MAKRSALPVARWFGDCTTCGEGVTHTMSKGDGRWTLRQLFTSSWLDCSFDVKCGRCGTTRWLYLEAVESVDLATRLNGARAADVSVAA